MAVASGKICDQCGKFSVNENLEGWLRLTPEDGKDLGPTRTGGFDLCSNACLLKLARARAGVVERKPRATPSMKADVVKFSQEHTVEETASHFSISPTSVVRWRRQAGVSS